MMAGASQSRRTAVVAGTTGVVGRRLARHLHDTGDWRVIGLSRRPPSEPPGFQTRTVDLMSAEDCRTALRGLEGITHIFYAARFDHVTTAPEPIDINLAMLRNLLDALEPGNPGLQHVHLVHGMKVYGATLGPYKTPAKETDPRVLAPNFYYAQEDLIAQRQAAGRGWTWSTSRPQGICDADPSIVRSMTRLVAAYAAISKELGLPLCYPGPAAAYKALYQCTESAHLAKAIAWIATAPRCANRSFNVTNGDLIRWQNLWPVIADAFGMMTGPVRTIRLGDVMADKAPVWERIRAKHDLAAVPFEQLAIWPYGDFIFGNGYDHISDLTRLRQSGFHDVVDTEQMFLSQFEELRSHRIIP